MVALDPSSLGGRELIPPALGLTPAEELASRRRGLDEAMFALLPRQLRESRETDRALDRRGVDRPAEELQRGGRIGVQVFIAQKVERNVCLLEPAQVESAPSEQALAKLRPIFERVLAH